ncbi:PhoD-like phosphatase [Novipirellula aureliae]|uniref:PhoD-like phosphatase n=1 Tax=Novipirellula aureliae TaxID=2527966 RepID=A0A5C6DFL3_9BACT|nr:alkaline phosphatase D family protein [Novipirellula aureliae]TWU34597.1 PhoD-like phosphatase [Novipirellula aureliae]
MSDSTELQRRQFLKYTSAAVGGALGAPSLSVGQETPSVPDLVSLGDAHKGTLEIDLRIMNQYRKQPQEVQDFYIACREALTGKNPEHDLAEVCRSFNRWKLGGPMLGNVTSTSVSVWMHLPEPIAVRVTVIQEGSGVSKTYASAATERILCVGCEGLRPDTAYTYQVVDAKDRNLGEGRFVTPPAELTEKPWRISFGGDFHKVGMYRPDLMHLIQERGSRAMLLIGDSAVDGRKDDFGLINTDYMLRNLSSPIQKLTAHVPVSATWDDHDYWGNDTSGARTNSKRPIDVDGLRKTWKTQWNNPERDTERQGIYFQTHFGPVHYIALDTRSCRDHDQRGKKNSFLGNVQMSWLKDQISQSTSPFIIISGGTMWSDYISNGKDSWGTWDTEGREEIFQWIDEKSDSLVVLLSGDRHGARGFSMPRPGNKKIYELEVGTLGGVPGPEAYGENKDDQLFGYPGRSWGFGEFTFRKVNGHPQAVFRLIDENGKELETISLEK